MSEPEATEHTIQIELEGLISLLAQHLYADPDVFLREMIQNAHDSISRRAALAAERDEDDLPEGEVRITIERHPPTLTITDNGSGLTRDEIHQYLATIGRSGTRELRDEIRRGRHRAVELIGQFGIGLLSAFIVAERVEVVTRSPLEGALRWMSRGGKGYTVEDAERDAVGTTVYLHLRSDHRRYLDPERLRGIIRAYADLIGLPIFVGDDDKPANAVHGPWHRGYASDKERHKAYHDYWEGRFKDEVSLTVMPVDTRFEYPDETEGVGTGALQGVLGITDRHVPDVDTRGTVDVYVSRMFVSRGNRDVLPPWARFIQGVIESPDLTPNAARDNVVRNAALIAAQERLGGLILEHLTALSRDDPKLFTEIMRWHSYHILGMCVQEEHGEFFEAVADLVMLESDQGPMSMPAYLETAARLPNGKQVVHYVAERGAATQYYLLCQARGLQVFNADENFAERFLQRYARTWPSRIHLSRLDVTGSETIFEPLGDAAEEERFHALETAYLRVFPDMRCIARASRFKPREVPAVLTETRDAKARREMEQVKDNVALPRFLRDMVKGFLDERRDPLTLHLNADNPIIRTLAARQTLRDEVAGNTLVALYNNALLLLARAISPENVRVMFEQHNRVLDLLLSGIEERDQLARERQAMETQLRELAGTSASSELTPHVTCFVAMPFRDELRGVYEAIEAVLEDVPFLWSVTRADERTRHPWLWENVKQLMLEAHCFVAEVSDQNPNVMLEIGRMEALERPILLLKRRGSPDPPADLAGKLYVEYEGEGAALVENLREEIQKQEAFCRQQGDRYLSPALLRRTDLSEDKCTRLSGMFDSVDAFLEAGAEGVAEQLGMSALMVRGAQEELGTILRRLDPER